MNGQRPRILSASGAGASKWKLGGAGAGATRRSPGAAEGGNGNSCRTTPFFLLDLMVIKKQLSAGFEDDITGQNRSRFLSQFCRPLGLLKAKFHAWLVAWSISYFSIYVSIYWEFHHPNWRTHIFQRGGEKAPSRCWSCALPYFVTSPRKDVTFIQKIPERLKIQLHAEPRFEVSQVIFWYPKSSSRDDHDLVTMETICNRFSINRRDPLILPLICFNKVFMNQNFFFWLFCEAGKTISTFESGRVSRSHKRLVGERAGSRVNCHKALTQESVTSIFLVM